MIAEGGQERLGGAKHARKELGSSGKNIDVGCKGAEKWKGEE